MPEIESAYQFRMVFTPPNGEPIEQALNVPALQVLLTEIRRVSGPPRQGRPWDSREMLLRKMLKARNALRTTGEPVTQATLLSQMDHAGDTRRVREWLVRLKLTWTEFLALD